jgi:hypothetical protein
METTDRHVSLFKKFIAPRRQARKEVPYLFFSNLARFAPLRETQFARFLFYPHLNMFG